MAALTRCFGRLTLTLIASFELALPSTGLAQIEPQTIVPLGLDLYMPATPNGPASPAVVELGRKLFFDPLLSRDSTVACSTCHLPNLAFTDGRVTGKGIGGALGRRNVPTLVNRGYGRSFFWDGRAESLESQVLQPVESPAEMDLRVGALVQRLRWDAEYAFSFRRAFGGEPSQERVARALAAYVRSIRAADSPFDRFVDGDGQALTEAQQRGLELFQGRARCVRCHLGPLFSDEAFHNTGIAWRAGEFSDSGRANVSGRRAELGAFKTPTLREVARTPPYMHDGSVATLEDVVEFYARGGNPNPQLDPTIRPLELTEDDKVALVAFLRSLSGRIVEGGE